MNMSPFLSCLLVHLIMYYPLAVLSQQNIDKIKFSSMKNLDHISTLEVAEAINDLPGYLHVALKQAPGGCGSNWTALSKVTQRLKIIGNSTFDVSRQAVAIDSFGKPGAGLLRGHTNYLGSFDECMQVETKSLDFSMNYCKLGFSVVMKDQSTGNYTVPFPLQFSEALCVPATCSFDNINDTLYSIDKELYLANSPVVFIASGPDSFTCTPQGTVPYTTGAKLMIAICCLFVLLVIIGTGYDLLLWYIQNVLNRRPGFLKPLNILKIGKGELSETDALLGHKRKSTFSERLFIFYHDAMIGFSLYKTVPTVLSTRQPPSAITSINGMRVISMFWVILSHTFAFDAQGFTNPFDLFSSFPGRFSSQAIMNGYFSVDSFFFLSGVLLAYLTFREMGRRNGKFPFIPYYVHRFLRLTPTYMFVLFFLWHITVHLGTGTNLLSIFGPDSVGAKVCHKYWWTNLLYINNFYPVKFGDQCMGWTWYLANDMQFFVISPLLLIPLYMWFPVGVAAIGVVLLGSFGVTGFIAGYYDYPANTLYKTLIGQTDRPDFPDESTEIYGKPYCRISPYLVGILLGYILYNKYRFTFRRNMNWLIHLSLWALAAILGVTVVYGLYPSWHGHELSTAENVTYYMFSRFVWGLCLAIVVFVCHNGYGGVINRFLSMPFWVPLSRMTFNAYLVHEIILFVMYSEFRSTTYYTDIIMVVYTIAAVVLAFGAAGVICVFVEFPLSNLESAVFKLFGAPLRESTRRVEQEKQIQAVNDSTVKN